MHFRIIKSVLDTDFYILTMAQYLLFQGFGRMDVKYSFVNRGDTKFPPGLADEILWQIGLMRDLRLTEEERKYLSRYDFLKPGFLTWLKSYRFDPNQVTVSQEEGRLEVIVEGPWIETIFWEVPLMAIISEAYYQITNQLPSGNWEKRAEEKAATLFKAGASWADFGTRRRFSCDVQAEVIRKALKFPQEVPGGGGFVGTSNVHFAQIHNIRVIGTMAHQLSMNLGACFGYGIVHQLMMDTWIKEFRGRLGIVLPDTFTTKAFLRDFGPEYARAFDGGRQDSGDPKEIGEVWVGHYDSLNIDPLSKTEAFSDGLTIPVIVDDIFPYFRKLIKTTFGIGTSNTNDVGVEPLNIVIKPFLARLTPKHPWRNVVKISDSPGKGMGDPEEQKFAKRCFGIS